MQIDRKPKHLTQEFWNDFPIAQYPELMDDKVRPYCVAILIVEGIQFAVPFRTKIPHGECYIFRGSPRSDQSGLDFTKAVVITKPTYIGQEVFIEQVEYQQFVTNEKVIANRFKNFINNYRKWSTDPAYYRKEVLMSFCTLQYFHKELGI